MAEHSLIPLILQLLDQEKQIQSAIAVELQPEDHWEGQWQYCSVKEMLNLPFTQRFDLAVVNFYKMELQDLSEVTFNQVLVRLRDLFAKKIIVISDINFEKRLRALGFSQLVENNLQNPDFQIWQFNILDYKHVPDWFNSKFWANPENWNKYRW